MMNYGIKVSFNIVDVLRVTLVFFLQDVVYDIGLTMEPSS